MASRLLSLLFIVAFTLAAAPLERHPSSNAQPSHPDYIPPVVRMLPPTPGSKVLTVTSWNVKHLGRKGFAAARAAPLLTAADIITLQEVNTRSSGLAALNEIAAELEKLTKERICKAISEKPSQGTELYAYLWKDSRVAYLKTNGDVMDRCPESHITIRLGVRHASDILREPAFGTFFFRPEARPFVLASIHLRPSGKRPQDEVGPLFSTLDTVLLPVIVAGDYNLDSTHSAFDGARAKKFTAAMKGIKTSLKMKKREMSKPYDNFWFRGVTVSNPRVAKLFELMPDLEPRQIYKSISDHCPITADFQFLPREPVR